MVGVGTDLWGSPSPTPLPKQGHLQQAAQDLVQAGLEYLQRRRIHNLPGQPVAVLHLHSSHHPHSKEVLPQVQMVPMLQFVAVAPCPVAGHHWKELGPILLTPTLQIFIGIYKVPSQPSLLQAKQVQLPQPFLTGQMLVTSSTLWPSAGLSPVAPHVSWTGEPRTGCGTPDGASLGQSRGRGESPWTWWSHS